MHTCLYLLFHLNFTSHWENFHVKKSSIFYYFLPCYTFIFSCQTHFICVSMHPETFFSDLQLLSLGCTCCTCYFTKILHAIEKSFIWQIPLIFIILCLVIHFFFHVKLTPNYDVQTFFLIYAWPDRSMMKLVASSTCYGCPISNFIWKLPIYKTKFERKSFAL